MYLQKKTIFVAQLIEKEMTILCIIVLKSNACFFFKKGQLKWALPSCDVTCTGWMDRAVPTLYKYIGKVL